MLLSKDLSLLFPSGPLSPPGNPLDTVTTRLLPVIGNPATAHRQWLTGFIEASTHGFYDVIRELQVLFLMLYVGLWLGREGMDREGGVSAWPGRTGMIEVDGPSGRACASSVAGQAESVER